MRFRANLRMRIVVHTQVDIGNTLLQLLSRDSQRMPATLAKQLPSKQIISVLVGWTGLTFSNLLNARKRKIITYA